MGFKKVSRITKEGKTQRVWVGFGKDEGVTRVNQPIRHATAGGRVVSVGEQFHASKIAEKEKAERQKEILEAQKPVEQKQEAIHYVTHEKTGQKVRISQALAQKIYLDQFRAEAQPKGSYTQFKTLLESRTPPKTKTQKFMGEMGQSQRALSSFAFGHDPEFVEVGGKPYKYKKGMKAIVNDEKQSIYPETVGQFDFKEAVRYGETGLGKGTISKAKLTKYDPISYYVRSGVEWEKENPIIASATYGAGAIFGSGVKGAQIGLTKLTTKFPSLMKFSPIGKIATAGSFGSMLGFAGYQSGKEIIGSSDPVRIAGEETAKWLTFGAGAHAGGKLFDTKLKLASELQAKTFEKIGYSPKSRASFSAQREIATIKEYENVLHRKTYTHEGLKFDKNLMRGFVEYGERGFPRQTQLIPTTEKGFDVLTRYTPETPKVVDTGIQKTLIGGDFATGRIYQTPETYLLIARLKGAPPITPMQPIKFAGKGLGKGGSLGGSFSQELIGKERIGSYDWFGEEYKFGGSKIGGSRFKIGSRELVRQPQASYIFKGKEKTNIFGWRFGEGQKQEAELGLKYGVGLLGVGAYATRSIMDIRSIKQFKDLGMEETQKDYSIKSDVFQYGLYRTKTAQATKQKQDLFQLPKLDLFGGSRGIVKQIPEFKPLKTIKEKTPRGRTPLKPIVEIPRFTPRAFKFAPSKSRGFSFKPIKLDIFPVSDLMSKTITELRTRKPATQRKRTKKSKKEFAEFIKFGGLFPTEEMVTGKIKGWKLRL